MEHFSESPYLKDATRLSDVVAAIQVMATYKRYKLDFKGWAMKISGDESMDKYWQVIFKDHPEFFRFNREKNKASLVWRRSRQRTYHYDSNEDLTRAEVDKLPIEVQSKEISRIPLNSSEITLLINTAINLHSRALENKKANRWWFTPVIGISGSLIGVVVGVLLKWWLE